MPGNSGRISFPHRNKLVHGLLLWLSHLLNKYLLRSHHVPSTENQWARQILFLLSQSWYSSKKEVRKQDECIYIKLWWVLPRNAKWAGIKDIERRNEKCQRLLWEKWLRMPVGHLSYLLQNCFCWCFLGEIGSAVGGMCLYYPQLCSLLTALPFPPCLINKITWFPKH